MPTEMEPLASVLVSASFPQSQRPKSRGRYPQTSTLQKRIGSSRLVLLAGLKSAYRNFPVIVSALASIVPANHAATEITMDEAALRKVFFIIGLPLAESVPYFARHR